MATINLLPWREARREAQKKHFLMLCGVFLLAGFCLLFLAHRYIYNEIYHQQARNQYLKKAIKNIAQEIKEIQALKEKKEQLLQRMSIIQSLQGNRPVLVRVFDEIARIIPEGVHFKNLEMIGHRIKLVGIAEANSQVSTLMRNLDNSPWFDNPNLTAVRKSILNGQRVNEFDLTIFQVTPPVTTEPSS
ncbi:hypothetical protein CI610_01211 [invertebrate metagenome]|uniref:Pilus assembly protein PilN n=1 Tax=invertebrate metagenome TaxID=1711999 RepID=A0A2H9T9B1_9ZZZZ